MSDLVGNPEDRFSQNEADITSPIVCKKTRIGTFYLLTSKCIFEMTDVCDLVKTFINKINLPLSAHLK